MFVRKQRVSTSVELVYMSFTSIQAHAKSILARHRTIDGLMLNTSIMIPQFDLTRKGLESQFGVNHVDRALSVDSAASATSRGNGGGARCRHHRLGHQRSALPPIQPSGGIPETLAALDEESRHVHVCLLAYRCGRGSSKLANVLFEFAQELQEQSGRTQHIVGHTMC